MNGSELIMQERKRQIEQEGWTPEHDDEHKFFELSRAAICYLMFSIISRPPLSKSTPIKWPWDPTWWKPSYSRIRNLVKAGALIAAEIDRLQRKANEK